MQVTFLNAAGTVLFTRDDMESGNWTQEEYTVNCTFPYDSGKVIERGQRIYFRDPATNGIEVFEIRNVNNIEPEHYQQFVAEGIAVSELSDEHINTKEITDKTPAQALGTVLTGTLWSVGNSTVSATQSVDISRGSVWQAVNAIAQNWNAYITPRLTFSTAGAITGRYLDIAPAEGVWRGVRLSIDKNLNDSSVVIDDSEVLTALYGYGGSVDVPQSGGTEDKTEELTFADVVWTATSEHPAKPDGQTYLEDPAKTALYGRNGRPRYGYYQNSDIKDANVLLQKTWESLQQTSTPKVSITGTVTDLYRLGYQDQPLRLHDKVIVEIRQTGEVFNLDIIRLDVDLIDPTATRPEIGSYIPNIVYINRETAKQSGGGGGGGSRGQTNKQHEDGEFYSEFVKADNMVGMVVGTWNGGYKIKGGEIAVSINDDGGTTAKLQADTIDIQGIVDELTTYDLETATFHSLNTIVADGEAQFNQGITVEGDVTGITNLDAEFATFDDLTVNGDITASGNASVAGLTATGDSSLQKVTATQIEVPDAYLKVGTNWAQWQSFNYYTYGTYESYFLYGDSSYNPTGRHYGGLITSSTLHTINYLGKWTS